MAITSETSNTTDKKKNYWECQRCSIEQDESLTRCGSCGEPRYNLPNSNALVGSAITTVEEKYKRSASSIIDQEKDTHKSSKSIVGSKFFFEHHFYQSFRHFMLMKKRFI